MDVTDKTIQLQGSLWMTVGGEHFGGMDRIALLTKIAECGSITKAAKAAHMSYKTAWDAIDTMNNLVGVPLVETLVGGKGGGGARLTQRGVELVENFQAIVREHQTFVDQLAQQAQTLADDYVLIRRMSMKTSARNQFFGTVTSVKAGAVNDEVELLTASGHNIVAIVTHESTESLGLVPDAAAFALIKSSSIIVITDENNACFSARNKLQGIISRVQPGAVNTEVIIDLNGGGSVAAIVTNDSCERLELVIGKPASAIFKASSVILAVPA